MHITKKGVIQKYRQERHNLDDILPGRGLLYMYQVTGENKYLRAAEHLIDQLENQPITSEGGYWHKKIYPYQMWLDGLYMAEPFQGHFAKITGKSERFDRILQQFKLIEK